MLGKLKIRCIYEMNGCKEILLLDNLINHEKSCRFDKKICEKCFCSQSVNHDCVKSLLQSKQELTQSNDDLKKELKLLTEKNSTLKSTIENYLQRVREQSNEKTISSLKNEVKLICCHYIISFYGKFHYIFIIIEKHFSGLI
jgi:LPS O-antigen subunit length determinant protein (WzzB/FepE family)